MNKRLLIFVGIGVVAVGIAVFLTVTGNAGSHLQLQGKILKVRTGALGDDNSIAVLDFRVENPSDIPFVVGNVELTIEKKNGEMAEGVTTSKPDLKQLFQYNRFLGDQYNEGLGMKDTIAPHSMVDRMVAARFEMSSKDLDAAKTVHLSLHDIDGPAWETSHALQ
ncbi:MAG TPA: hypothetical protein VK724_12990 [Bryobacteraceae bacterium]|jgi:hypothetical protein|nr:hypothetical protein [Bryobacteraceae bacterium]